MLGGADAGKNVVDLAHTDGIHPLCLHRIQQSLLGRLQRIVMAVGGALVCPALPNKGTGNDTAHTMLALQQITGNMAVFIQLLNGYNFLMGGDLDTESAEVYTIKSPVFTCSSPNS